MKVPTTVGQTNDETSAETQSIRTDHPPCIATVSLFAEQLENAGEPFTQLQLLTEKPFFKSRIWSIAGNTGIHKKGCHSFFNFISIDPSMSHCWTFLLPIIKPLPSFSVQLVPGLPSLVWFHFRSDFCLNFPREPISVCSLVSVEKPPPTLITGCVISYNYSSQPVWYIKGESMCARPIVPPLMRSGVGAPLPQCSIRRRSDHIAKGIHVSSAFIADYVLARRNDVHR